MARVTTSQQNWSSGELSPNLFGRYDLNVFYNGSAWLQNFIGTTQGLVMFRNGSKFVWNTRDNAQARLVPFEYNTTQAYVLEFTNLKMRIIKDGGIVVDAVQAVTGITKANPAVVTYAGADSYANGQRVILTDVVGMTEVNNQEFIVANVNAGANTFELQGVDSTGYTTYVSGGSVELIVEVVTPYATADLFVFDYASLNDVMYLTKASTTQKPVKLTRSSHVAWTMTDVTMISDPFGTTLGATQAISGATKANPCVITYVGADTFANGDTIYIDSVIGMVELNKKNYTVANVNAGANTLELQGVDSTLYTAYGSVGTLAKYTAFSYPGVVTFFEQRLYYAASVAFPQSFWGSKGAAYDTFLFGTADDDAFKYTIASGKGNTIIWMAGTTDFLAIGTTGGEFKATGGGSDDAITPTNISVKPTSYFGSAAVKPAQLEAHIMYIQRDELTLRSYELDALSGAYTSVDRNLAADHITDTGLKQLAFQSGRGANIIWGIRNDGVMTGTSFEPREQVNGWHRHKTAQTVAGVGYYESVAVIPQARKADQTYYVAKRTINGATVRYIEYFADQPVIPQFLDYYTGKGNKASDKETYLQALWEAQKRLFFVDCGLSYDGSDYATQALDFDSIAVGSGITVDAGGSIFTALGGAALVGREIWGSAGGRAKITAYVNDTRVTVKITVAFPDTDIAAGDWYLTTDQVGGAQHLEGEDIIALCDGGVVEGLAVEDGLVDFENQASYITIGLKYVGIMKGMNLEGGGDNGPSQTKLKSVSQAGVRFLNTLGALFGTDPYKLDRVPFRSTANKTSRPPPLFSGDRLVNIQDGWSEEKNIYCVQDKPLPCNVQLIVPYMTTNDG